MTEILSRLVLQFKPKLRHSVETNINNKQIQVTSVHQSQNIVERVTYYNSDYC